MPTMEIVFIRSNATTFGDRLMAKMTRRSVDRRSQRPVGIATSVQQSSESRRGRKRHLFDDNVFQLLHPGWNFVGFLCQTSDQVGSRFRHLDLLASDVRVQRFDRLDPLGWQLFLFLLEKGDRFFPIGRQIGESAFAVNVLTTVGQTGGRLVVDQSSKILLRAAQKRPLTTQTSICFETACAGRTGKVRAVFSIARARVRLILLRECVRRSQRTVIINLIETVRPTAAHVLVVARQRLGLKTRELVCGSKPSDDCDGNTVRLCAESWRQSCSAKVGQDKSVNGVALTWFTFLCDASLCR